MSLSGKGAKQGVEGTDYCLEEHGMHGGNLGAKLQLPMVFNCCCANQMHSRMQKCWKFLITELDINCDGKPLLKINAKLCMVQLHMRFSVHWQCKDSRVWSV